MITKTFLVEIGTEELPSKSLRNLAESFSANFSIALNNANLSYSTIKWFATPRRLALKVSNLSVFQLDREVKRRGPSIIQAFDIDGKPSKAAKKWAHSCGITVDQAERLITEKGEWLLYRTHIKGKHAKTLLPDIVETSLSQLSIAKLMRWGTHNIRFLRPVHTVTLLLDDQIIPAKILGIKSDRIIRGHRFMGECEFIIDNANQYPQILLEKGKVIADYEQRKTKIKYDVEKAAKRIGGNVDLNNILLEEITSLVEWPVVLIANFEKKFLTIPIDIVIHIMKYTKKYLPIYAKDGRLISSFIFVVNIESSNPFQIISDNEKVIQARLADATFFFNTDSKIRLENYLPYLQNILFQKELGTLQDRTIRMQVLSSWIAEKIGANINYAARAGLLSQCDLITDMVFEFPEIKGLIGMHYARHDGEEESVSVAINEQYYPRFADDILPSNLISCAVAIANKIDILVGIFGINQYPKSNRDPFALRRTALGLLRIIFEKKLNLDLQMLIEESVRLYSNKLTNTSVVHDVTHFMLNRFLSWYQDKGYSVDTIQAVLACRPIRMATFDARIKAISYFRTLQVASELFIINKRISNILAKSNEELNEVVCISMLKETAEIQLEKGITLLNCKLQHYLNEDRYQDALIEFSTLCNPVNDFFKNVIINTKDRNIRINRLTLLAKLHKLLLQIADISLLQLE